MKQTVAELLEALFHEPSHPLHSVVGQWLIDSKHFRDFSTQHALKIRSKLRNTTGADALQDLRFELETAHWLLQDKRFSLSYEEHGVRTRRGPDFVVTFTTSFSFGVEVTRLQFPTLPAGDESEVARQAWRIGNAIAVKLGQMNNEMGNLLVVGVPVEQAQSLNLEAAMRDFRSRAQAKDETLLKRSNLSSVSAFFKHYQRLTGIMVRTLTDSAPSAPLTLWTNSEARYPFPSPVLTCLKVRSQ